MSLDEVIDQAVMIMVMALFLLITVPVMSKMYKADYGGFGTQIEKTALKTDKSLAPLTKTFQREDIILTVAVTDEYEPNPRLIKINSDNLVVKVDSAFLGNKIPKLIEVNNALPKDGSIYKLETIEGINKSEAECWKFTKIN